MKGELVRGADGKWQLDGVMVPASQMTSSGAWWLPPTRLAGPTAEDILRERLRETELKYQAHFQTNMELRLKVASLEAQVASLDRQIVAYLASDAPPKAEPDPVHRALKFGAGNHPKIGLVT